jgi:hypothetical protein
MHSCSPGSTALPISCLSASCCSSCLCLMFDQSTPLCSSLSCHCAATSACFAPLLLLLPSCCCSCTLLELFLLDFLLEEDAGAAVLLFEAGVLLGVVKPAELGRAAVGFRAVMCCGVRARPLLSVHSCSSKLAVAAGGPAAEAPGTADAVAHDACSL